MDLKEQLKSQHLRALNSDSVQRMGVAELKESNDAELLSVHLTESCFRMSPEIAPVWARSWRPTCSSWLVRRKKVDATKKQKQETEDLKAMMFVSYMCVLGEKCPA